MDREPSQKQGEPAGRPAPNEQDVRLYQAKTRMMNSLEQGGQAASIPQYAGHAREQVQTYVFRTPENLHFTPKSDMEAIAALHKTIATYRLLPKLHASALKVLEVFCAHTNGKHFRKTGELFAWPGEVRHLELTDLCPMSIRNGLKQLVSLGILNEGTATIDGTIHDGYYLQCPEVSSEPSFDRRRRTIREARKQRLDQRCERKKMGKAARTTSCTRHPGKARTTSLLGAPIQVCAPAPDSSMYLNSSDNSNRRTETTGSGRNVDATAAAAKKELEDLGIGAEMVTELLSLRTTTAVVCKAAGIEAAKRPEDKRTGLIVSLVRKPTRLSKKSIAKAEAQLQPHREAIAAQPAGLNPKDAAALKWWQERSQDEKVAVLDKHALKPEMSKWGSEVKAKLDALRRGGNIDKYTGFIRSLHDCELKG